MPDFSALALVVFPCSANLVCSFHWNVRSVLDFLSVTTIWCEFASTDLMIPRSSADFALLPANSAAALRARVHEAIKAVLHRVILAFISIVVVCVRAARPSGAWSGST